MAKQVKLAKGREFTFEAPKTGGASKHPWDEWFNGDLLLLEQSEGTKDENGAVIEVTEKKDFEVSLNQMPNRLKQAARRRYKIVDISRYDANRKRLEDAFIIRARDMNDEEREAEDLQRIEDKERQKAMRAKRRAAGNGDTGHDSDEDNGDGSE